MNFSEEFVLLFQCIISKKIVQFDITRINGRATDAPPRMRVPLARAGGLPHVGRLDARERMGLQLGGPGGRMTGTTTLMCRIKRIANPPKAIHHERRHLPAESLK